MADPVTAGLGVLSIGTTIFGGVEKAQGAEVAAEGAVQQAQAQQQSYNYQAGVADINSKIAKQNADFAMQQGEEQAARYGLQARDTAGKIKAAQGSSGVDVNSGSPVNVRDSQKVITNLDLYTIRSNAAKTAYGFTTSATSSDNQAQLLRMGGVNAGIAAGYAAKTGQYNVDASILGTVGSVSDKWLSAQRSGMFSTGSSGSSDGAKYDNLGWT